jgi:competence protein ComEC
MDGEYIMKFLKSKWLSGLFACVIGLFLLTGCGDTPPAVSENTAEPVKTVTMGKVNSSPFKLTMLDVGKADGMLLQIGKRNYLIDTGLFADGSAFVAKLRALGVTRIDGAFLTHPHKDHIGGMVAVLNSFHVEKIYVTNVANKKSELVKKIRKLAEEKHVPVVVVTAPTEIELTDDAKMKVLWPGKEHLTVPEDSNINPNSMVMRLSYKNFSLMFTGDAYTQTEDTIMELYPGTELTSTVLKVAHHSNRSSTGEKWLKTVSPQIAIISCGTGPKGKIYPNKTIMKRLKAAHIKVYDTFDNGAITITSDGEHYAVSTEK